MQEVPVEYLLDTLSLFLLIPLHYSVGNGEGTMIGFTANYVFYNEQKPIKSGVNFKTDFTNCNKPNF